LRRFEGGYFGNEAVAWLEAEGDDGGGVGAYSAVVENEEEVIGDS
jgi:hypothetical protein